MGITFSRSADPEPDNHLHEALSTGNGSLHSNDTPRIRISDTMKLPNYHVRQGSLRSKQPLPDPTEVETQFAKLLVSLKLCVLFADIQRHFFMLSLLLFY